MLDDSYVALVKKLADEDSDEIFNNSSTDHASVVIGEMFRKGEGNAHIFTGSLNPILYSRDEIVDAIGSFLLDERNTLKVLVQDAISPETVSPAYDGALANRISTKYGHHVLSRLTIKIGGPSTRSISYHFASIGGKAFRFEQDKNKHEAFASFNRPELASRLESMFSNLWAHGDSTVVH